MEPSSALEAASGAPKSITCSAKNVLILAIDATGSFMKAAIEIRNRLQTKWDNLVKLFGSDDLEIVCVAFGDAKFDLGETLFVSEPIRGPKIELPPQSMPLIGGGGNGVESPELAAFFIGNCLDLTGAEQVHCFFFTDEPGGDSIDTTCLYRELGMRTSLYFMLPGEVIQENKCWEHLEKHFSLDLQELQTFLASEEIQIRFLAPEQKEEIWPHFAPNGDDTEARTHFDNVCRFGEDALRTQHSRFALTSCVDFQSRQSRFLFHFPKTAATRKGTLRERDFDKALFGQVASSEVFEALRQRMQLFAFVIPSESALCEPKAAYRWWETLLSENAFLIANGEIAVEAMLLVIAESLKPGANPADFEIPSTLTPQEGRALTQISYQLARRHADLSGAEQIGHFTL